MDKRKAKAVAIPIFALCIGGFAGAYAVNHYLGKFMLWGAYMDATADANIYVSVLSEIKTGNDSKAIEYLEMYLANSESILQGCEVDLCKDATYPEFEKALKLIESYRQGNDSNP